MHESTVGVLDSSGNPVLQYMNVGRVDLYGVDGRWQYRLTDAAGLRGTLSYVRGKNEDNGDNLYRIAMKHYGKPEMTDAIYELNKQVIGPDPAKLTLNTVLKLPDAPKAKTE